MQGFKDTESKIDECGHFLQSKEWEEFQRSLGREVFRVHDILFVKLPLAFRKSYLYSAGAQFPTSDSQTLGKQYDAVFLKIEPMTADGEVTRALLGAGFIRSKKEVQPQKTIVLDLTRSEDELGKMMRPKTRYNIRLSESRGVKITHGIQGLDIFWELLQKTSRRDKFSSHSKKYYEKLLELPITQLFTAEYQGQIIAANVVLFYGGTAYYLHGASDYDRRSLMAPYFLHWETVRYAKEQGYTAYDFWGADEKKWPGVTRFKRGFGGREVSYVGSYDYIFESMWYALYSMKNFFKHYI